MFLVRFASYLAHSPIVQVNESTIYTLSVLAVASCALAMEEDPGDGQLCRQGEVGVGSDEM